MPRWQYHSQPTTKHHFDLDYSESRASFPFKPSANYSWT